MAGNALVFLFGEGVAQHSFLARHMETLEFELRQEDIEDEFADRFLSMEARQDLKFVVLLRGELDLRLENYFLLAPGLR